MTINEVLTEVGKRMDANGDVSMWLSGLAIMIQTNDQKMRVFNGLDAYEAFEKFRVYLIPEPVTQMTVMRMEKFLPHCKLAYGCLQEDLIVEIN